MMHPWKLAVIAPLVVLWTVPVIPESAARCDEAINKAKALSDAGNDDEAKKYLDLAIKSCTPPKTTVEKQRLAVAHLRLGAIQYEHEPAQALLHFRKAVSLDPDNMTGPLNLGAVLTKFGQFPEAISILEAGIKHGTDDKDLQFKLEYNAGFAMLKRCTEDRPNCDSAGAEQHFLRASELNPGFADTYFNLAAFANDVHHDSRRAMQLFKKACDLGHEEACFQYNHFKSQLDPPKHH